LIKTIRKYLARNHSKQANWFAEKTIEFIHKEIKGSFSLIKGIRAYYNPQTQSCILKIEFDTKAVLHIDTQFLYVLHNYQTGQMENCGLNFEKAISDDGKSISWIQDNKLLVFNPDNETMSILTNKLNKTNGSKE